MNNILLILKLIPVIIEIIKSIEAAIPGQGKGEEKLAALRSMLELVDANAMTYWPTVEKIVGVLVGLFNKTGAFQKA